MGQRSKNVWHAVREQLVRLWKDKLAPRGKAFLSACKTKIKEGSRAFLPTMSRLVRATEAGISRLISRWSERSGGRQRVPRGLLFLILGVMATLVVGTLIVTIALGARFFSCVCHPSERGSAPVVVTETNGPTQTPLPTPEQTQNPDDTYLAGEVFHKGDKNEEVIPAVQQRLMDLGYMDSDEPTDYFGSYTLEALKLFQLRNGLDADGELDEETYAALFSQTAVEYVMQIGDTGETVSEVQERLYELGYLDKDSRTGTFGEKTSAAVEAFQLANKLTADGLVGEKTREALYADDVVGNVFKRGDRDEAIIPYQERLIALGYLGSSYSPNGTMDDKTVSAIKSFQDANGLVRDGVLGPTTMNQIESDGALKYALRLGMSGSKVKDAQRALKKLGYLTSSQVTGYFDEATESAVKLFQKRNNLSQDGAIGSKTLAKLNDGDARRAPATPSPTPKPTKKPKVTNTPKPGEKTPKPTKTPKATQKPDTAKEKIEKLIAIAESKLGCPYVGGAKGPNKFDCSGFVYWCLNQAGVKQGYMTSIMWRSCSKYQRITSWGDFKRGDIMVFKGSSMSKGHVGIYLGNGKMIDAASGANEVRITSTVLSGTYWKQHFLMAYRIWS